MVIAEDALTDGKAESSTAGAIREKRFENVRLYLSRYTWAIVANVEGYLGAVSCA